MLARVGERGDELPQLRSIRGAIREADHAGAQCAVPHERAEVGDEPARGQRPAVLRQVRERPRVRAEHGLEVAQDVLVALGACGEDAEAAVAADLRRHSLAERCEPQVEMLVAEQRREIRVRVDVDEARGDVRSRRVDAVACDRLA